MTISYGITVCDEISEIQRLITVIEKHKREQDEIVVLYDKSKNSKEVEDYLNSIKISNFSWYKGKFEGNFANWKNILWDLCKGDYIFFIDADEVPSKNLIEQLPFILEYNNSLEVYYVPRINIVNGITENHIKQWGWKFDENGWVNYPDMQLRISKRIPEIRWTGKVHETLTGFNYYSHLPMFQDFDLHHVKDIKRQEKQNNYYNSL